MARNPYKEEITASGPQAAQPGEDPFNLAKFGAGAIGVGALGFVKVRNNNRVWDHYISAIKAAESGFPGGVLKTFRISESLSIFESWNHLKVDDEVFKSSGNHYSDYLRKTFGANTSSVSMNRTGSIFGDVFVNGKVAGIGLNISAGTQKGAGISDYYARVAGLDLGSADSLHDSILKARFLKEQEVFGHGEKTFEQWKEMLPPSEKKAKVILGAQFRDELSFFGKKISLTEKQQRLLSKAEVGSKYFRAKAATTAGRLNNLLAKPLELPIIEDLAAKFPALKHAPIKPGTSLQMLGRYTKKGLMIAAGAKALSYYDYLLAEDKPTAIPVGTAIGATIGGFIGGGKFNKWHAAIGAAVGMTTALVPKFDEGLFYGIARTGADINVARAKASEAIGLTESLKRQEEITGPLVSGKAAIGFTGVGALSAGLLGYSEFLFKASRNKAKTGRKLADVFDDTRFGMQQGDMWKGKTGKFVKKLPGGKTLSKIKSRGVLGAIAGLAAWTIASSGLSALAGNYMAAIPGLNLLGTTETAKEKEDIYSGEKEVGIRKGRWWEFGRSSKYEGGKVEYFRKHALERLRNRAYQKGIYGSEEEKWAHDPILHPLKALFGDKEWKYHYDLKNQYSRPAPLSSTYGEDIPFIGPLVAATFGRLFKPRIKLRQEEWDLGGGEYTHLPDSRKETEPYYNFGGLKPGAPVSPEDPTQLFNELNYRRREAIGLPGFVEGAVFDSLTGREERYQNLKTIETMGKERGSEYWLWSHLNVGGAAGSSELIRRFIPHERSYLDKYNPLRNDLPWWMPGDDYFMDLKHGNPFNKIKEAEIRLPGEGYAALNPDVKGVEAEDYPLMHRLKILADVAMWSDEYKQTMKTAKSRRKHMSQKDQERIKEIERQVRIKKRKKEFSEYRFNRDQLKKEKVTIKEVLSPKRFLTEEHGKMIFEMQGMGRVEDKDALMNWASGLVGQELDVYTPSMESRGLGLVKAGGRQKAVAMFGDKDYAELISEKGWAVDKGLDDEFEQLRFSDRERKAGAISEKILHGIDSPLEMVTPFSPASKFIRERSAIEEYEKTQAIGTGNAFWNKPIENFLKPAMDMLMYNAGKKDIPEEVQQRRAIEEYFDMIEWVKAKKLGDEHTASETTFGADVFADPRSIFSALPRRDRDYFKEFQDAKSEEERQKILDLTPSNQDRLYSSVWMKQEAKAARAKRKAGIATDAENAILATSWAARKSEGFEISPELEKLWMQETDGKIPYDEWIRKKKAEEYFATHSLPGADWLGWHPGLDLEDVKLKYVEQAGLDHHDFDLWGTRKRSLARKPYINDELIGQLENPDNLSEDKQVQLTAKDLMQSHNQIGLFTTVNVDLPNQNKYDIEIVDSREDLVGDTFKYMGAR